MGIHTPIDRPRRFGDLFGIRDSYAKMSESIEIRNLESTFYNLMISNLVESGNLDKIERFAKKNRALCEFAQNSAVNEAYANAELSSNSLNIPRIVKQSAAKKVRDAVSKKALSIKTNSYKAPNFSIPKCSEPTIYESQSDFESKDGDTTEIDNMIKNVAISKGIIGDSNKTEKEIESDIAEDESNFLEKHNYSIELVELKTIRIILKTNSEEDDDVFPSNPAVIFPNSSSRKSEFLNSTIDNVINGINGICRFNIPFSEYIFLANGRPEPHFHAQLVVNSEVLKGNDFLNTYYGLASNKRDYIYTVHGTPREDASENRGMDYKDRDIYLKQIIPIIHVYAKIRSWDNINGQDRERMITKDDFRGSESTFVD